MHRIYKFPTYICYKWSSPLNAGPLDEFKELRSRDTQLLRSKELTEDELELTGIHPAFGEVTLKQLLSTWVVHDLNHIAQIARVMAKQYQTEVGPWSAYLKILNQ